MSSEKKLPEDDEVSFEGILDLGTVPPPPGSTPDVHAARTAVAQLPQSLLDELKHAKELDASDVARTRIQPRFDMNAALAAAREFGNEAPTAPGKHGLVAVPTADDVPPPPMPPPPPPPIPALPLAPPPVPYVAPTPSPRVAVAAIVVFGVAIFAGVAFLVAIVRSLVHR